MASVEKIREAIAKIVAGPRNVTSDDIRWVVENLGRNGHKVDQRAIGDHGTLYIIDDANRFSVCTHKSGGKQIKLCYVHEFIKVMSKLELL